MQIDFELFRAKVLQEHRNFKDTNDSIFIGFLGSSWQSFNLFFNGLPTSPKPSLQPLAPDSLKGIDSNINAIPFQKRDSIELDNSDQTKVIPKNRGTPENFEFLGYTPQKLSFFDAEMDIYIPNRLPHVEIISGKEITIFFAEISGTPGIEYIIEQMMAIKRTYLLNDWGYLKLAEAVAKTAYIGHREQTLLHWVILLKSGYDVKIGYNTDKLVLLISSEQEIYNSWFLEIEKSTYYIVSEPSQSKMPALTVHKASYPSSKPMVLTLESLPLIGEYRNSKEFEFQGNRLKVPYNESIISFLKSYPLSELGIYFATPLSVPVTKALDNFFLPLLNDLCSRDILEVLLSFTQKSFDYKTDKDHFGYEKFYFAEEIFYHPYSDCEDRSILMAQLVKRYTGLSVIGLSYPGHVNLAVNLPFEEKGFNIKFKEQNYLVCDPTYRNAPLGYQPHEYRDIAPQIITFD